MAKLKPIDSSRYFDRAEHELLDALDELSRAEEKRLKLSRLFVDDLHPLGIKELAAPREIRIALAMFSLLHWIAPGGGGMKLRIAALAALQAEVFEALAATRMPRNAARAVLAVTKELVRSRHDQLRRLELARQMRLALSGQPRIVRRILRHYKLLEMPESGNQLTFDHHVHDANSKGRKAAAHLVLDAWIKGIRTLEVIYYDDVPDAAAEELLGAAEVMKICASIGVAHQTLWRDNRLVELIFTLDDCASPEAFRRQFSAERMMRFREQCRAAAEYRGRLVAAMLADFNVRGRLALNRDFDCELPPITPEALALAAAAGQPAPEHIAELATEALRARLEPRALENESVRQQLAALSGELIRERYLDETAFTRAPQNPAELPEICRKSPAELLELWHKVAPEGRATLNLSHLSLPDVVELVYECTGRITDLEIFNLKDMTLAPRPDDAIINRFRLALNHGDVLALKSLIRIAADRAGESPDGAAPRRKNLMTVLKKLSRLIAFYRDRPLGARAGSDSAGRSSRTHGMGLAVLDTLPARSRKRVRRDDNYTPLPLYWLIHRVVSYPATAAGRLAVSPLGRLLGRLGWRHRIRTEYVVDEAAAALGPGSGGNVVTLGGFYQPPPPGWRIQLSRIGALFDRWQYWNTRWQNTVKITIGLLAAFASFYWSGSNAFLVWCGAPIWLGITWVRNILQAMAGGGWRHSKLLHWRDFVSFQRVADSLLYTGLSVPVLENLVKNFLIGDLFQWNAERNALAVFSLLAVANSLYMLAHNLYRGLPRTAVVGNVFRPLLAIPVSILFGWLMGRLLEWADDTPDGAAMMVQQYAAILAKLASDCVGGLIEGYAERESNIDRRVLDWQGKLGRVYQLGLELELLYPKKHAAGLLKHPSLLLKALDRKNPALGNRLIVNALDMLYFWMYRPLAPEVFRQMLRRESPEARSLLLALPKVLGDPRRVTTLFTGGLLGDNFHRALAFYLNYHEKYLKELQKMIK